MSRIEMKPVHATGACEQTTKELRATIVKGTDGTRTMMLPADPMQTVKILSERRAKKTPAGRARAKIDADLKRRGI